MGFFSGKSRKTRIALNPAALLSGLVLTGIAVGQNILPGEVRMSSKPYVPPSSNVLRVETRLVEVGVVVRDKYGRPIGGLKQGDFRVFDGGKERTISAFSVEQRAPDVALAKSKSAQPAPTPPVANPGTPPPAANLGPPRYVALFFDDQDNGINTTAMGDIAHARIAAERFVKEDLGPNDRVGIFTSSATLNLDFTNDVPKLIDSIHKLHSHPRVSINGGVVCPRITPYEAYLIANSLDPNALGAAVIALQQCSDFDGGGDPTAGAMASLTGSAASGGMHSSGEVAQVKEQADETWNQARQVSENTLASVGGVVDVLAKKPGTRMVLLSSSGFLAGTLEDEQDRIVQAALHAGVVINALDSKGLYAENPGTPIDEIEQSSGQPNIAQMFNDAMSQANMLQTATAPMANLAESTGGLFFHDNNDLNLGFYKLGVVPEVTYLLGFSPEGVAANGAYHKLKVEVSVENKGFIQARPGYFAPKEEARAPLQLSKVDQEILATDKLDAIPMEVTSEPGKTKTGEPMIWVTVHIDPSQLKFQQQNDRNVEQLNLLTVLYTQNGEYVSGAQVKMDLALKDETLKYLSEKGINAKVSLAAPAGEYNLREVVQDSAEGKLSAVTIPAEIR